jgi:tetratricopeptide (TPR) repeat protein
MDYLEQSLALCRESGDRVDEGWTCWALSLLCHHLDEDDHAWEYGQQALRIAQEHDDRWLRADALLPLGHALAGLGQLAEAAAAYRDALEIWRKLGLSHSAAEPLAGLARVALAQGDPAEAQARVEEILKELERGPLVDILEPFRVYLTCYRVLHANGDRRAEEILCTAHSLLQEQAANIDDEALRHSFLESVAAHRDIIAAWSEQRQKR